MATTAASHHAHPLNLMACVREASPQELQPPEVTDLRSHESKKRRFHPLRGLRRMFRRKPRHPGPETTSEVGEEMPQPPPAAANPAVLDNHRSRSTSELLAGDEPTRRRSGTGLFPGHSGLSVSHDSVFTAEHRSSHSSSEDLDIGQSSSSLSIQQLVLPGVRAELLDAVRRRRGRGDTSEDEEDLGLPRSPCNSPTTADVLLEKALKENPTKSHSTCSDGSLLSMGSSEMDEDSISRNSGHGSKLSLHDKSDDPELDLGVSATPLSHSAARHKMSVRPKRTHGAPRRRRIQQIAAGSPLPTTPELNEETLGRGPSPELTKESSLPEPRAAAMMLPPTGDEPGDEPSFLNRLMRLSSKKKDKERHGPKPARRDASARQIVRPINIPASPEIERRHEVPPSRMQVSYSVSPPKPTWPNPWNDFSTDKPYWKDTAADKSGMRITGLSSYRQQVGNDLDLEERECMSLMQESRISRYPVKKSHSFRADLELSVLDISRHNRDLFTNLQSVDRVDSVQRRTSFKEQPASKTSLLENRIPHHGKTEHSELKSSFGEKQDAKHFQNGTRPVNVVHVETKEFYLDQQKHHDIKSEELLKQAALDHYFKSMQGEGILEHGIKQNKQDMQEEMNQIMMEQEDVNQMERELRQIKADHEEFRKLNNLERRDSKNINSQYREVKRTTYENWETRGIYQEHQDGMLVGDREDKAPSIEGRLFTKNVARAGAGRARPPTSRSVKKSPSLDSIGDDPPSPESPGKSPSVESITRLVTSSLGGISITQTQEVSRARVEVNRSSQPAADVIRSSQLVTETIRNSQPAADVIRSSQLVTETIRNSQPAVDVIRSSQPAVDVIRSSQPAAETIKSNHSTAEISRDSQSVPDNNQSHSDVTQNKHSWTDFARESQLKDAEIPKSSQLTAEVIRGNQSRAEITRSSQLRVEITREIQPKTEAVKDTQIRTAENGRHHQLCTEIIKDSHLKTETMNQNQLGVDMISESQSRTEESCKIVHGVGKQFKVDECMKPAEEIPPKPIHSGSVSLKSEKSVKLGAVRSNVECPSIVQPLALNIKCEETRLEDCFINALADPNESQELSKIGSNKPEDCLKPGKAPQESPKAVEDYPKCAMKVEDGAKPKPASDESPGKCESRLPRPKRSLSSPQVPEFLTVQLNKVDSKPVSNVVLTTTLEKPKVEVEPSKLPPSGQPVLVELRIRKSSGDGDVEEIPPKQRAISVGTNRFPTPARPPLKKQAMSLDSAEGRKEVMRKQMSQDFDDITIIEKQAEEGFDRKKLTNRDTELEAENVIMRKKSISRDLRKDEEPELLKVFARRSLKLKDSEGEALGQQIAAKSKEASEQLAKAREKEASSAEQQTKSRDSDKENEGAESPKEERKKPAGNKEPLGETTDTPPRKQNNPRTKLQRSSDGEGRQRSKTVPEATEGPHRVWASSMYKDSGDGEEGTPQFKRIQQRREEWEQRLQQASK